MADDLHRSPGVRTKVWGDKSESVETEYEMDSFENKLLPGGPQKGKRIRPAEAVKGMNGIPRTDL